MNRNNDHPELSPVEKERGERREKKRRPKMAIHGRSIVNLVRIIQEKARGQRSLVGKKKRKRREKQLKR